MEHYVEERETRFSSPKFKSPIPALSKERPRSRLSSLTDHFSTKRSTGSTVNSGTKGKHNFDNTFDEEAESNMYSEVNSDNPMFTKKQVQSYKPTLMGLVGEGGEGGHKPKPPSKPKVAKFETGTSSQAKKDPKTGLFMAAPPVKEKDWGYLDAEVVVEEVADESFDNDYEAEQQRLDNLPFSERIWEKKIVQRLIVAALAIALLWSSSLLVIRTIVEGAFFPKPSFSDSVDSFGTLFNLVDVIREAFTLCNAQELTACASDYERDHFAEVSLVANETFLNSQDLTEYEGYRFDSKLVLNDTLNSLIAIVQQGFFLASYYKVGNASTISCPRVEQWVIGQLSASDAFSTYSEFTNNASAHIQSLLEQLEAREAYDQSYTANKTLEAQAHAEQLAVIYANQSGRIMAALNGSYFEFSACMGKVDGLCNGASGILGEYGTDVEALNLKLQQLNSAYLTNKAQVDQFVGFYNQIVGVAESVNTQTGFQYFEDTASQPSPAMNFDGLFENVPHAEELEEIADSALQNGQAGIDAVSGSVNEAGETFANNSREFYGGAAFTDEPYDPPPIDASPVAAWDEAKETETGNLNDTLTDFKPDSDTFDDFEAPSQRETNFPESPEQLVALLPNRTFDFYTYSDSIFTGIDENIVFATNLITYADITYRVIHSAYLVNKYWTLSSIGKPPADVRLSEIRGKAWGLKQTQYQRIATLLTHPAVISAVMIIFSALIASAFWRLYSPFYEEYQDGCVQHTYIDIENNLSSGTMVYRNVFTVAYDYAVSEGDSLSHKEVDKLNVQREVDCQENFQSSLQQYQNDVTNYLNIKSDYLNTVSFRNEVMSCLKLNQIDSEFGTTLQANLNDDVFLQNMTDLLEAVYNCTKIPVCEFSCEDPPESIVQLQSHKTSCTAEWWLHASILASLLVIVTFILTNVFRIEFMKALVRIWWRHLNPYDFLFLGSCTREGQHVDPEEVTKDNQSLRRTIRDGLKKQLKSWEMRGYFHAAYAVFLNAPWLAACVYLSKGIKYD